MHAHTKELLLSIVTADDDDPGKQGGPNPEFDGEFIPHRFAQLEIIDANEMEFRGRGGIVLDVE